MHQLPGMLVRLNLETRFHHAAADRPWLDLVVDDHRPTEQEYMRTLVRVYGFEAPLEAALAYTPNFDKLVDMSGRYRSGLIAQDLLSLGLAPAQVSRIAQRMIAPFAGVTEALGWLYIHERATLAHEAVRLELVRRSPELARATSYLGVSTGVVGARMEALGQVLDQYARTSMLADRIASAAQAASLAQVRWFDPTTMEPMSPLEQ